VKFNKDTHIIIVTYNGMPWLERTLSSIPEHYPVIIIDNASSDMTCDFIKKNFAQHTLLEESKNLGFGQANNKGISLALSRGAQGVFLLNQDAYLEPDTINLLVKTNTKYPDYGILSPIHYDGKGDKLDHYFSKYMAYDRQPLFYGDAIAMRLKEVYEVPFVNAAGWYLPKKTLDTIGGFDPVFFHYGEDDNYIQRARFHKYKVGVVPASFMYHDREDRIKKKPEAFSPTYFKTVEKMYKVRLADVRLEDFEQQLTNQLKKLKKHAFKSRLRLNFKRASGYLKERTMLMSWSEEIRQSRSINQALGSHYL